MSFALTYATRCLSGEKVGCVEVAPAPRACVPVPLAFATDTPFTGSTKAICAPSADHDGSVAPVSSVALPEPSGFVSQIFVLSTPQVYAISPLSPGNALPSAALRGTRAQASTTSAVRPRRIERRTHGLYRLVPRRARTTDAPADTSRAQPCRRRAPEERDGVPPAAPRPRSRPGRGRRTALAALRRDARGGARARSSRRGGAGRSRAGGGRGRVTGNARTCSR